MPIRKYSTPLFPMVPEVLDSFHVLSNTELRKTLSASG